MHTPWKTLQSQGLSVELYRIDLQARERNVKAALAGLSDDERERAGRFRFAMHRRRYVMARAALRNILAEHAGLEPNALDIATTTSGKPFLKSAANPWRFNVAHSRDLALIAVTQGARVGVDLEYIDLHRPAILDIAECFTASERRALRELPEGERLPAFYRCWSRKEALVKAQGAGIADNMDRCAVGGAPGMPRIEMLHPSLGTVGDWLMFDLDCGEFAAALVVENMAVRTDWVLAGQGRRNVSDFTPRWLAG